MRNVAQKERAAVQRLLDVRRQTGIAGNDLVARMLRAEKPDGGGRMTDEEIIDNLATFLLAGHETTAKALTWTLYLLARSPEWQERVRNEVADVTDGQPTTAEQLNDLHITRRVLKESMRVFPPVPVMTRVAAEDVQLGPIELKSPTLIVLPIYAIHRHHKLWQDADRFDPDRFLPENEEKIARTQFMPFGFGQRVCIGASFAQMEALAILATLITKASFAWDGKWLPEPVSRVTLRPKGGMPLQVTMLSPHEGLARSNPQATSAAS